LVIAKQAADLHTNYFSQQVISQYLKDNALDDHIEKITEFYGKQKQVMMDAIAQYFPADAKVAEPEGGMFLWVTLPKGMSAMELFDKAIKEKVAFVPGKPFYVGDEVEENTLRLSYVTVDEASILEGIKRLGRCMA
jgi:2-aminoadipate transaminase